MPGVLTRENGGATVTACLALSALLVVTVLVAQVGVAVVARHRAQSAADLGALAAAGALDEGTVVACARARTVTDAAGVRLRSCAAAGWDVLVVVEASVSLGPIGSRIVGATARAGLTEQP
ncbi:Rv3654c family TadE-like protein [Nocardia stercoris]|uniref:Pilus assembly protein TadE n=1 Tax=Nocardia stercoris TaxID=2483361 RepID=A0A3M2L4D0_9NOCA|nr:Rv3654c family TadE-like protein [Nocardia stercoris]RMI29368.1 pilus assembly protein TadE [Nocardia stercoris]